MPPQIEMMPHLQLCGHFNHKCLLCKLKPKENSWPQTSLRPPPLVSSYMYTFDNRQRVTTLCYSKIGYDIKPKHGSKRPTWTRLACMDVNNVVVKVIKVKYHMIELCWVGISNGLVCFEGIKLIFFKIEPQNHLNKNRLNQNCSNQTVKHNPNSN